MSYQNIFRIAAKNGVRDGADPLPLGAGMLLGSNLNGLAVYTNAWPFQNLVAQSESWREFSGTGAYTIDNNDQITSIEGDRVLSKYIAVDVQDESLPMAGTWRIRWTGTAEVAVGNGTPPGFVGWQNSGDFTWSHTEGLSIIVFVRSPDGNPATFPSLEVLPPGSVDGQLFRSQWFDFIESCNFSVIRCMDWNNTNGSMVRNWADRTQVSALTYSNTRRSTSKLHDYDGAQASTVPYEHQAAIATALGAGLWVCIPTRATEDYAQQMGALLAQNYPVGNLTLEYANEPWNWTFSKTTTWLNYLNATKRVATGVAGSNTATTVDNDLVENQQIVLIFHEQAEADPDGSTQLRFGPQTVRAINVTTDTFDIVTDDGANTPLNFDADIEIVYWFPTSEHDSSMDLIRIVRNYGVRATVLWDAFLTGWQNAGADVSRITEILNGQSSYWQLSAEMFGPQGSNGRGAIAISLYFQSQSSWTLGDTPEQMGAYDAAAVQTTLGYLDNHVNADLSAYFEQSFPNFPAVYVYEFGHHWVPNDMLGGTIQQRIDAVLAYDQSEYMAENYQTLIQGMADRGVVAANGFVFDINSPGQFGLWGMQVSLSIPDQPKTTLVKSFAGFVPQS